MLGISMLTKDAARRFALGGFAFFFLMLMLVPVIGWKPMAPSAGFSFPVSSFSRWSS
jgi:hypothetical protein